MDKPPFFSSPSSKRTTFYEKHTLLVRTAIPAAALVAAALIYLVSIGFFSRPAPVINQ